MRIVAGRHRGARLAAPPGEAVRPTSDRAREALFNVLDGGRLIPGVAELTVLDGFAGTGALGLEALSRGARHAVFIERDPAALAVLRQNVAALGERDRATLVRADACHPPGRPPAVADLALLDPPYRSGEGTIALAALAAAGWLAPGCLAVIETDAREDVAPPAGFALVEARRYGRAKLTFLRYGDAEARSP